MEQSTSVLTRFAGRRASEDPAGPARARGHPAGELSREGSRQLSARIQRFQIRFLWLLNQFLGYKWKGGGHNDASKNKSGGSLETPQNPARFSEGT